MLTTLLFRGGSDTAPDDAEPAGIRLGLWYGPRRPRAHEDMSYSSGPSGPESDDG